MVRISIIICLFFFFSCKKKVEGTKIEDLNQDKVFNQVFHPTIDTLMYGMGHLKSNKLVLFDTDKKLKENIIKTAVMGIKNDTSSPAELIRKLAEVINDSVTLNLKEENRPYEIVLNQEDAQKLLLNDGAEIFFNISKIVFLNGTKGCFYIGIHCGKNCSRGCFVFIKENDQGKWELTDLATIWRA